MPKTLPPGQVREYKRNEIVFPHLGNMSGEKPARRATSPLREQGIFGHNYRSFPCLRVGLVALRAGSGFIGNN